MREGEERGLVPLKNQEKEGKGDTPARLIRGKSLFFKVNRGGKKKKKGTALFLFMLDKGKKGEGPSDPAANSTA